MSDSLQRKVIRGSFWVLIERISAQMVGFVVTIILARLLSPSDYGSVALLTIFTSIAGVIADGGFGGALVQKKDASELDFNSVFYISIAMAVFAYLVLCIAAPYIAEFYRMPELTAIMRVSSLTIIFHAINSVQSAELARKMLFHLSFKISLSSTLSGAITGISLAFLGFGPWALVWQLVAAGAVGVVVRWFLIAWRPRLMFSFRALKPLFRYGWKVSFSDLIDCGFKNLYGLVIGRYYSAADLAFVNKGNQLPRMVMDNVNGTLARVSFPALASLQSNQDRLLHVARRLMIVSNYMVIPLMLILASVSDRVVLLLFGANWAPAVPFMQLACITFAFWPIQTVNNSAVRALGRSDIYLKVEIVGKALALFALLVFITRGVLTYMISVTIVLGPIGALVNGWPNRRLLGYGLSDQVKDVGSSFFFSIVAACPSLFIGKMFGHDFFSNLVGLLVQGGSGILTYVILTFIFRTNGAVELVTKIHSERLQTVPIFRWIRGYLVR